jgi:biuret amidohydrolase
MSEFYSRNVPFARGETALLFVDLQRQFLIPGLDANHPELGPDHYFYRRIREIVLLTQRG